MTAPALLRRVGMFYIYENWQAGPRKAIVHHGGCGHCNDGKGRAGSHDPAHARWHGPFDTLDAAESASRALPAIVNRGRCRCVRKHGG